MAPVVCENPGRTPLDPGAFTLPLGRRMLDRAMTLLAFGATVLAIVPLILILGLLVVKGAPSWSVDFFTGLPKAPGEAGAGVANAIVGSAKITFLAASIGIPIGILGGIYLAQSQDSKVAASLRFLADVSSATPAIVVGLFLYATVVVPMKRFSALAGALALAILMLPTITRATEEVIRMVPHSLREASLALGVSDVRTTLLLVVRTALPGIATAVLLAVARVSGETAPLLLTTLNHNDHAASLDMPTATLTVQIYQYAGSPYADQEAHAWGAALLLVLVILSVNVIARFVISRGPRQRKT